MIIIINNLRVNYCQRFLEILFNLVDLQETDILWRTCRRYLLVLITILFSTACTEWSIISNLIGFTIFFFRIIATKRIKLKSASTKLEYFYPICEFVPDNCVHCPCLLTIAIFSHFSQEQDFTCYNINPRYYNLNRIISGIHCLTSGSGGKKTFKRYPKK